MGFLEEAEQSIAEAELAFLSLESEPDNKEHINKIFRLAHNLKGSSKAVGFEQFGQFTHEFETFVLRVKNDDLKASATVISVMLKVTDFIKTMTADLKTNLEAVFSVDELLNEMKNFSEDAADESMDNTDNTESVDNAAETPAEKEAETPPVETALSLPIEPILSSQPQEQEEVVVSPEVSESVPVATQPEPTPTNVIAFAEKTKAVPIPAPVAGASPAAAKASGAPVVDESIRVSMSKIEKLLNLVGEMVILQSVLSQNSDTTDLTYFKKTADHLGKVTKEIQDLSMSLRMVPVKTTFQKMQRIVRDTAQLLNKDVLLMLTGEETELDKSILENINDPLVHLIRNSVDHGIEPAEKRTVAGKSVQGKVWLKAFHRSGKLIIEVVDDGAGLDAEKLKKMALAKGIIKATDVLTEVECFKLIFAPGFSTKEQVTETSGRGVGMDVVKTNIEKLGGEIEIESVITKGTTIRIILPLTMAIIDGLITTYNNNKYVIPLAHVHETLKPEAKQIYKEKNLGSMLILRGENLPLYYLGDFFNEKRQQAETNMIAFVFRSNNKPFAVLVDDIIGLQQIVVKRLSVGVQGMKGVSGTTILGDGKPSLILEPNDLLLRPTTIAVEPKAEKNKNQSKNIIKSPALAG